jgi:subtilase family serine protease
MIRRLSTFFLTIVALVSVVNIVCLAQSQPPLTHHVREVTANGEAPLVGLLPTTKNMRVVLVLPLRNQAQLQKTLKNLYDPSSPSFHHFLTVPEFTKLFGPTQKDYNTVVQWAQRNGLKVVHTSRNRVNLDVTGSVKTLEAALHITMGVYQHPTESRTFFAPDREPTPDLPFRLWHIAGLDNYSIPRPMFVRKDKDKDKGTSSNATTGSGPDASFLGSDMRAAYYEGTALTGTGQTLGLLEFAGTDLADLDTYYANVNQTLSVPISLVSVDGTSTSCTIADGCDDTEQTIDMTQALGMAPGLAGLTEYIGSTDSALLNGMATGSPLNSQLSSSWTWAPADPSTDDPYFQEFATQGQSYFQAAGDGGAWSSGSEIFPADDPFVTSAGGTDLETSAAAGPWSSETAWVDGGGGHSPNGFAIPYWQSTTVATCSECSTTLRNGPDVSANSNFTFYVCADQEACTANLYGGTSFATPMWAGYIALANQQSVANGGSTAGFINPALYNVGLGSSYDTDLHDITSGSNGFDATVGYDLATGWGSPNSGTGLMSALVGTDFFLSASPVSQTLKQGSSTTYTLTLTALHGFSGTVSLSTSCPSSATCALSPQSVTVPAGGTATSTLTVSASSTAPGGTFTLTLTGTSGSLTHTGSIQLVVVAPDFSMSLDPTATSVFQGMDAKFTVTLKSVNGFSNGVTLSTTACPADSTCSFSPAVVSVPSGGSATSVFSVKTKKKTPTGRYLIPLTGTSGSLENSVTADLTVFSE